MNDSPLETPVVFFIFNRPDITFKVFEAIRQAQPKQLLVVADGPRHHKEGEAEQCELTREIIDRVDWDCQVAKNYSETNLGCAKRVATGLDWAFDLVEEAILLEDDNLPHPNFFRFCRELLTRYRNDRRVRAICGVNVQFNRLKNPYSYYFSLYNHTWGWATWKRAWQDYDFEMKLWPQARDEGWLYNIFSERRTLDFWTEAFEATYKGNLDSYAYRWLFASWINHGLSIIPNVNLVSNLGFGAGATHTVNSSETTPFANMPVVEMLFPLDHPPYVMRDRAADILTQNSLWHPTKMYRAKSKAQRLFQKLITH